MTSKKIKQLLITMLCISITVITVTLFAFLLNFRDHSISNLITDWGAFGDYFGGVLNTSISFISLIILSFLTYLVSKQSSIEEKNNNILMRKMDAYDKLSSYFPIINQSLSQISKSTELMGSEGIYEESLRENRADIYSSIKKFSDAYHFLFTFKVRYSHIFKYDFDSKEFKALILNSKKVNEYIGSIKESFDLNDNNLIKIDNGIENFVDSLVELINHLRDELE